MGHYSALVRITDLTDNVSPRQITLAVVTPPRHRRSANQSSFAGGHGGKFQRDCRDQRAHVLSVAGEWREFSDAGQILVQRPAQVDHRQCDFDQCRSLFGRFEQCGGLLVSSNAYLTIVSSPPVIVQQPVSQTVLPAAPASFSVAELGRALFIPMAV